MQLLSENLKKIRKSKGLTQRGLADILGVTKQTIANIEQDIKGKEPSISLLNRLAEALGVTVKSFFEE